eukprot:TRINITY_DN72_c0_g1_i1.p1 TRINITY_DN72_c0_g1~~TRINITY_DN72_c0_g1_i1.p1  ORF type:complete len:544 (-),score=96.44 TRINITY_DN72_c0_g1_i1:118-1749(-)
MRHSSPVVFRGSLLQANTSTEIALFGPWFGREKHSRRRKQREFFRRRFCPVSFLVDAVKFECDSAAVSGWNSWDAVGAEGFGSMPAHYVVSETATLRYTPYPGIHLTEKVDGKPYDMLEFSVHDCEDMGLAPGKVTINIPERAANLEDIKIHTTIEYNLDFEGEDTKEVSFVDIVDTIIEEADALTSDNALISTTYFGQQGGEYEADKVSADSETASSLKFRRSDIPEHKEMQIWMDFAFDTGYSYHVLLKFTRVIGDEEDTLVISNWVWYVLIVLAWALIFFLIYRMYKLVEEFFTDEAERHWANSDMWFYFEMAMSILILAFELWDYATDIIMMVLVYESKRYKVFVVYVVLVGVTSIVSAFNIFIQGENMLQMVKEAYKGVRRITLLKMNTNAFTNEDLLKSMKEIAQTERLIRSEIISILIGFFEDLPMLVLNTWMLSMDGFHLNIVMAILTNAIMFGRRMAGTAIVHMLWQRRKNIQMTIQLNNNGQSETVHDDDDHGKSKVDTTSVHETSISNVSIGDISRCESVDSHDEEEEETQR